MNAMTDRYLAAALDGMPESRRAEVGPEIRGAIAEMVQVRIESGEPEAEAVRLALTELGDPVRFAESYQDKPRVLIGPGWYPMYLRMLKLVPSIVLPVIAGIVLLVEMGLDGTGLGPALLSVAYAVVQTAIVVLFAITLGFAIAERAGTPSDAGLHGKPWTPDDLPEPIAQGHVGLGSTIGEIVTALVFGGLVFVQDRRGLGFFAPGISDDLQDATVINQDIPAGWSWAFFGLILVTIAVAIVRYRGGVWSGTALLLTLADALLWIVFIVALAIREPIFSPALGERIDAGGDWWQAGGQLNSAIAIVVILSTLPDLWEAWQGYRETRRMASR